MFPEGSDACRGHPRLPTSRPLLDVPRASPRPSDVIAAAARVVDYQQLFCLRVRGVLRGCSTCRCLHVGHEIAGGTAS